MMRKCLSILSAALVLVSCNSKKAEEQVLSTKWYKGQQVTLTSSLENNANGQKVAPKDITASGTVKLYWQEEDKIKVTISGTPESFELSTGAGEQVAEFQGSFPAAGSEYEVEYPAVTLQPNERLNQNYVEKSFQRNLLRMTGHSNETSFKLKAIDGVISFYIKGEFAVKCITLDDAFAGAMYKLDCTNGGSGVQLSKTEATPFSFVLPEGALSNGYTVKIYDVAPDQIGSFPPVDTRARTTGANTIQASNIWRVNIVEKADYVDLGLSVNWGISNLGGTQPTDYGKYYAWAELNGHTPKTDHHVFNWANCPFTADGTSFSKYTTANEILAAMDDAARQEKGGTWRLPTVEEWNELLANCHWEYKTNYQGSGVNGLVFSRAGYVGEVFFPAAGHYIDNELFADPADLNMTLLYWASDNAVGSDPLSVKQASNFSVQMGTDPTTPVFGGGGYASLMHTQRCFGLSIRPVVEK